MRCAVKAFVRLSDGVPKHDHLEAVANAVAAQLRRERQRCKLSMNAVAERAGLSQQMVSYVERGMRNPTLDTLLRMAAALEVDLAAIITAAQRQSRRTR